jgi:hypothetical protein
VRELHELEGVKMPVKEANMTLVEAAAALGRSYNVTLRLVLTRELRGERRDGRWFVSAASVDRLLRGCESGEPGGEPR